ncbi:hypothetical protein [Comamonas composti]|uniref:hypothetical protein n=1 Tax=Comamonas composti TaxID=408558 RepID=UPI0012EC94C5|nr:hypothetical protein [Comamonas composti]
MKKPTDECIHAFELYYALEWDTPGMSNERLGWVAAWEAARKPCLHQIAEPAGLPPVICRAHSAAAIKSRNRKERPIPAQLGITSSAKDAKLQPRLSSGMPAPCWPDLRLRGR